jgi:glycosyltransferase involved in cell wall biosynthesis
MAAADVFAMPSNLEPFGLVYTEAMAMELPVVALANGGTIEVVEHGVDGLLSDPGDAKGLAANLHALLVEPERRSTFGSRGRRRVEQLFTTKTMAAAAADVFEQVATSRPARRAAGAGSLVAGSRSSESPERNGHAEHLGP